MMSVASSTDRERDKAFMAAALALGRREIGATAPNPAVGALLVQDDVIVGRGWTRAGGRPHAETGALREAGERARGATLYVTLEPCSHYGATPPCAVSIIAAGVARVVSALHDPDSRVAGRGHAMLRAAGVTVTTGILEDEARRANLGHVLRVTEGRPAVTLKLAETADGFAAGTVGAPRLKITGPAADNKVQMLRATHNAIMVGIGTARADNPRLDVRLAGFKGRQPRRVVIDSNLSLPLGAHVVTTAREQSTLVIAAEDAPASHEEALAKAGIEIIRVARNGGGRVDMGSALKALALRGMTRILSEGGPILGSRLIVDGHADDVVLLTSKASWEQIGHPALDEQARAELADASHYRLVEDAMLENDRLRRYERML
ncbi:MAG TPA: bifunctional diaminohydroxyphosphoribosylaminopyrimidine deaminase/5-amino-6-(5-phosphoribosylamino)uracil reductase RibD [Beijerinckiaceae bacterium]|nr:bifunctional diaminohydroxyphosphoribosylaminopyrimidine deaminase/5-amino-6-(5-phosphoribosylamino)uracil reductase RibD [Beijerinckiaceae bacterium]